METKPKRLTKKQLDSIRTYVSKWTHPAVSAPSGKKWIEALLGHIAWLDREMTRGNIYEIDEDDVAAMGIPYRYPGTWKKG